MATKKNLGSAKRFGTRYGKTQKTKVAAIEKLQRKKYSCPYCSKEKVRRLAMGIWQCEKCGAKFTGKAYTISKKKAVVEESFVEKQKKQEESEKQKEEKIEE